MYIILHILIKRFLYFGYKAKINGKINTTPQCSMTITIFKIEMLPPPPPPKYQGPTCTECVLWWYNSFVEVGPWYLGGKSIRFCKFTQILYKNWIKIIDWHSQLNIVQCSLYIYGHKYQTSCFLSSTKIQVIWLHSLLNLSSENWYAIHKRSQSTFGVFCKFYTFSLAPNKHRVQLLLAMA